MNQATTAGNESQEFAAMRGHSTGVRRNKSGDCPICLVPHDEEIHVATLHVRQWFRYQVTKRLDDGEEQSAAADRVA